MLIALLAVLGVNLVVIVVFIVALLGRRRWLHQRPGAFRGMIHVVEGAVPHLGQRSRRGYGRWVRDVLVFTTAPLFLRNTVIPVDRLGNPQEATGKVRRMGDSPRVVPVTTDGAHLEITVHAEDVDLVRRPIPAGPPMRTG